MQNEMSQSLADKIAKLLQAESGNADLAAIRTSLDQINARLEKLEGGQPNQALTRTFVPPQHVSQEKFAVIEAFADEIFAGLKKEKTCTFEANDKPCDHCSMCSSRGF